VENRRLRPAEEDWALGTSGESRLSFTAVLLAGGASQRMGSDKAELCAAGEPLWAKQLKLLRALSPRQTWISARNVPRWCPAGVEVVLDTPPSRGPLSGLCACLDRLGTTHLIVLAVDLPRMSAEHLHKLIAIVQAGRSLIPMNGGYFEPLCAIYCKSGAPVAAAGLAANDLSLQDLVRALMREGLANSYELSPEERSLYLNLNRPEDLAGM
jgi:molybdenum cofactor guanylyltransferase